MPLFLENTSPLVAGKGRFLMTLKLILTVIQVLLGVFLTAVVLLQEAKTAGMNSAVGGGAKSWDAKLARWTKWVAIGFVVLTLVISLV